jgi:hypothetical protein
MGGFGTGVVGTGVIGGFGAIVLSAGFSIGVGNVGRGASTLVTGVWTFSFSIGLTTAGTTGASGF